MIEIQANIEDMLLHTDKIVTSIQKSEVAARFWQARDKMAQHAAAQTLFEELKRKTNQALTLRDGVGEQHPRYHALQAEAEQLEAQLAEIPVAMQYKEAQDELNGLVQEVVQILLTRLRPVLPVELGPKQGCGQGHDGNGCSCGQQ